MSDLVAFLEARITEDADDAVLVHDLYCDLVVKAQRDPHFGWECTCHVPARVLAECKAKRALIADIQTDEHYADYEGLGDCMIIHEGSTAECTCGTDERIQRRLAILAQPYADHPDFDPTWTL